MVLPVVLFYILFSYVPMVGIQIAFKDFKPMLGMWASPLTDNHGFAHFIDFFTNPFFWKNFKEYDVNQYSVHSVQLSHAGYSGTGVE